MRSSRHATTQEVLIIHTSILHFPINVFYTNPIMPKVIDRENPPIRSGDHYRINLLSNQVS